ncbi:uncharacterized protein Z518_09640 [Rhinocladiella mackenziei CBS 650.93]|uniref:Rhinocladiella mackenziei CBS 650.93 unplaced genomic scaffold supercont1.8, whole genome shotgun sequence n=1 Tax=Rhinocladiella mackenziei CBS 650.93 TaxID=1442369 RepID=A0A0D2IV42_9EURO|nr:uncharacterized protein Z518_09640 [Rhinocladiella mackenziei CBS 650.93]KIX00575.1 hypothetical protein Z518_09640 [Rhinocladiella mackenziei CBS 650.93]
MAFQVVPIRNVNITSTFWSLMQQKSIATTLPAIVQAQKSLGHWQCLTWKEGHSVKPHPFWDSDIYKIVEAICYALMKHPNEPLLKTVEEAIDMIRAAQYPDGYINSYYTVRGAQQRWSNLRDMHELYCVGHLLEATVAYEELTGSGRLLDVARKAIAHVDSMFGGEPSKKKGYPGHQEIEIGLLRFHELTGDALPLKLAKYFITERGRRDEDGEIYFDKEAKARGADPYDDMGTEHKPWYHGCRDYGYHQADCPLEEAAEVKGHSVRAMYFYTAATDLVRLLPESKDLTMALDRLWRDLVDRKIYVTGGIGSVTRNEGFGPGYRLDDLESQGCYAETCASFALINWCQRLLRLNLKSEYADIMEKCLYNSFLGAVSTSGDAFYYQNVMRTIGGEPKLRNKWFGVSCCPPNVGKLLNSMDSLIYSITPDRNLVAIHLYIGSEIAVPGTSVVVSQETNMPWTGEVTIDVRGTTALALRIPGWSNEAGFTCSAQGKLQDGYLYISEVSNTKVHLNFTMSPQRVYAHPKTGKDDISIIRGPLVYCLEDVDNDGIDIDHVALLDMQLKDGPPRHIGLLDNVATVLARGRQLVSPAWEKLYGSKPWEYGAEVEIVAIPYFLRANRGGNGAMRVWTKRMSTSS